MPIADTGEVAFANTRDTASGEGMSELLKRIDRNQKLCGEKFNLLK